MDFYFAKIGGIDYLADLQFRDEATRSYIDFDIASDNFKSVKEALRAVRDGLDLWAGDKGWSHADVAEAYIGFFDDDAGCDRFGLLFQLEREYASIQD